MATNLRDTLTGILGVSSPLDTGKYLGLPSLIGKRKDHIFSYLKDRIWRKMQGWQRVHLSITGRDVLIKSVAQTMPQYYMKAFLLPPSLLEELQRLINSFWRGMNKEGKRVINWLKWERMCTKN